MAAGATIWVTGLPAAGKSTLARAVVARAQAAGIAAYALDADELRAGLNSDLGFTRMERAENVRRVAHVARILAEAGVLAVAAIISPYSADRALARATHERAGLAFLEVWIDTPLEICVRRDSEGLYAGARRGRVSHLTGVSDPYEAPLNPELRVVPGPVTAAADRVIAALRRQWNPDSASPFGQPRWGASLPQAAPWTLRLRAGPATDRRRVQILAKRQYLNGDIQTAAGALIVLHGLRRCDARPGDSVRCVACGVPIVADEWAVVERAGAAFHAACSAGCAV